MTLTRVRIGGVPEHFNYPWHHAINSGKFRNMGIDVQWISYPGGTGQMTQSLRNDECDICMVLTEGAIADIVKGNPSRIISGYVQSPLIWGIHTAPEKQAIPRSDLFGKRFAISRFGSGSHLMPIVHGLIEGKKIKQDHFIIVNDIDGAISSLQNDESDIFYWEKYTTKPYVERKQLNRIDEFVTPWPCFMIMATNRIIDSHPEILDSILRIIHQECDDFMSRSDAPDLISREYGIQPMDARHWFHATEWYTNSWVSNKMLKSVLYTLLQAGIIADSGDTADLVWKRKND
ncbi:substrate-binding domain-containing protein [Fulvivirga sedimenti]|uniref:Substrate-binding domain-containing protein n=1 Tax=Fulvivirga sedimenti TaxID=2879465 RepID=A0A9X1HN13_9BACT|nr:substrate-binding domain-containing protein [Fulvivirga sedimenti]MCA6074516.1 substrate-binding domain-containing protein [Fulvivirga sedimenti]MCA6075693.1 substrate-binding domain-containing protein [Fulvivirga sedimenti]MCA6076821.1 substrate-binding domain-containing protein [Fulvivirga sedimenti]